MIFRGGSLQAMGFKQRRLGLGFKLQGGNLGLQQHVFLLLALQEAMGQQGFFFDAVGGQQIRISELVSFASKVLYLEPAFGQQGLQAEVGFAQAHAQSLRQLALHHVRVGLQQAHNLQVSGIVGCRVGVHAGRLGVRFWVGFVLVLNRLGV